MGHSDILHTWAGGGGARAIHTEDTQTAFKKLNQPTNEGTSTEHSLFTGARP